MAPAANAGRGSPVEFTNFGRSGPGPVAPPTLPVVFGRGPSAASATSASASSVSASAAAAGTRFGASSSTRPPAWSARSPPVSLPPGSSTYFPPRLPQPYGLQSQPRPPVAAGRFVAPEMRQNSTQSSVRSPLREGEADKRLSAARGLDHHKSFTAANQSSIRPARQRPMMSERDREEQAKARRLLRFSYTSAPDAAMGSVNQPQTGYKIKHHPKRASQESQMESNVETKIKGVLRDEKRHESAEEAAEPRQRERTPDGIADFEASDGLADEKDWHLAEPILGTCPDMCPESERQERERKGDLDRFERLDGEKNQTSRELAVKKYTRTAEREPSLIRPLPVLQKTLNHLLGLLERRYDEELLGLYNFLWDRMRAIRMDLRMQHIFTVEAILMHEHMIRFHILAMHELCEYTNEGGPSEGFDGHLNIEQMNKASVDLFQMYEEHTRRGTPVPSEAEFRGYYALLKLDKHPGHFVEPAELSMDLAKMNPAMRNTPEVLFARDVARSCRTGNYIAFFRLARKATYLQACLMHAHFSKLRTHALASLYSGLQKNQGIPIIQIAEWLGMEGEDIEELLDHHGFSIRQFEEPYMVKEGPFLNSHMNYPTRRSQLVISKCSMMVVNDVKYQGHVTEIKSFLNDRAPANAPERIGGAGRLWRDIQGGGVVVPEEEMPDYEEEEAPSEEVVSDKDSEMQDDDATYAELNYAEDEPQPSGMFLNRQLEGYHEVEKITRGYQYHELDAEHQNEPHTFRKRKMELQLEPEEQETHKHLKRGESFKTQKHLIAEKMLLEAQDVTNFAAICAMKESTNTLAHLQEDEEVQTLHNAEAMAGRIRFWLRRWRLRTSASIQDKSHKKERAEEALRRLALGPPLREIIGLTGNEKNPNAAAMGTITDSEFDLNEIIEKRSIKLKKMWTELDVPSLVAQILKGKNPQARCLCWKLVVCSRLHDNYSRPEIKDYLEKLGGEWLKFKLFKGRQAQGGIQKSFHHRSKIAVTSDVTECQFGSESSGKLFLCYIAQELGFINKRPKDEVSIHGASGVLFLLLSSLPIDEECSRLHALVESIPSGSCLPLLILTTQASVRKESGFAPEHIFKTNQEYFATILQLDKLDRAKVSCWLILSLTNNELSIKNNPSLLSERHVIHLSNLPKHADNLDQVSMNSGNFVGGFYENVTLIEGLQWLASKAPAAPNVHRVHVRDLVLEHLEPPLRLLLTMHPSSVTPESCIGIFNRSLENAMKEIKLSASTSIPHWPPPELGDLSESAERDLLHAYLPSTGWNEPAALQPILDALQFSMLPPFPNLTLGHCSKFETINFLPLTNKAPSKHGIIDEIHNQKLTILYTFAQYMGQLGEIGEGSWSTGQQVEGILEKSSILNWTGTGCDVIPRWPYLFQIIYQTRLLLLDGEPAPVVYVLRKNSMARKRDEYEKSLVLAQGVWGGSPVFFSLCSSGAGQISQ